MDWIICLSIAGVFLLVIVSVLWVSSRRNRKTEHATPTHTTSQSHLSDVVLHHSIMRWIKPDESRHWNMLDFKPSPLGDKSFEQMEQEVTEWFNDLRRRGRKLVSEAGEFFVVDQDKQPPHF